MRDLIITELDRIHLKENGFPNNNLIKQFPKDVEYNSLYFKQM